MVLLLIAAAVFLKQRDADITRFGVSTGSIQPNSPRLQAGNKKQIDVRSLVPAGFETLSKTETYEAENLYEKINGKAPLYTESGFVRLYTQRFINKNDQNLWMELFLYDMANIRNAFSVYSVQKRADSELLPDTQFGYRTSETPYIVHGKYYVEFIGSAKSAELFDSMLQVTKNICTNLTIDPDTQIPELNLFPQEHLVPGSHKLYMNSAFGFQGFTDTFAAHYESGDEKITAFLSRRSDSQDAQRLTESYRRFLIDNGAKTKTPANQNLKGGVFDFYGTTEIVLAAGTFVAGIHEADSQQPAEELALQIVNKLSESANSAR
jgi:hypothetical protein